MNKLYYVGIIEQSSDGYYMFFPDLPGCVVAGDTLQEAATNAEAIVALYLQGMTEDRQVPPAPTAIEDIVVDPDVTEVGRLLVGVPVENKAVRVNVMLSAGLLAAIDAVSDNRSRFLSDAAQAALKANDKSGTLEHSK